MTESAQNFWQDHSDRYLEMALSTAHCERIAQPDGYGKRTGECGDTIEMFLSVSGGRLETVSYQSDGCLNTNACACTVATMAEGRTLEDGWNISPEEIVTFLETLPSHEVHCAELAVGAFYLALSDAQRKRLTPDCR